MTNLTENQNKVYKEILEKAVKGMVNPNARKSMIVNLGMNAVSFGLVVKALSDKKLIDVNKDKSISVPLNANTVTPTPPVTVQMVGRGSRTISNVIDEIFNYVPEDRDPNLFHDLKECGATFTVHNYTFHSADSKTIKEMKRIIEFYQAPNSACTPTQRKLRDAIIEKFNIDMESKKIDGKVYMINTNGLADLKDIVKYLKAKGIKSVIEGNKVVFS